MEALISLMPMMLRCSVWLFCFSGCVSIFFAEIRPHLCNNNVTDSLSFSPTSSPLLLSTVLVDGVSHPQIFFPTIFKLDIGFGLSIVYFDWLSRMCQGSIKMNMSQTEPVVFPTCPLSSLMNHLPGASLREWGVLHGGMLPHIHESSLAPLWLLGYSPWLYFLSALLLIHTYDNSWLFEFLSYPSSRSQMLILTWPILRRLWNSVYLNP